MNSKQKIRVHYHLLATAVLFASQVPAIFLPFLPTASCLAQSEIDEEHKAKSLAVLNYVTGWSLDSAGYHPAVYMLLENISGRDLSNVTIKMQGKFTDIHTLEPSTAKVEIRRSLKPHQQFPVALISPREHELPRDTNFWPVMECKAMMRVGQVGDEGTEYLLVTKVDSNTATQDEAFQKLNELTSFNRSNPARNPSHHHAGGTPEQLHVKPLIAKADKITGAPLAVSRLQSSDIFGIKNLPGLGEDFYQFEKTFGMPVHTDAKKKDFTWAKFKSSTGTDLIIGSKGQSGKADLIAFVLTKSSAKSEQALVEQCKLFGGAQKNVKLPAANKSVRYLPSGRVELVSASAPGLKILTMSLPSTDSRQASRLVMITRLPQEPDEILRSHQAGNEVLKGLPLGEEK